MKHFAQTMESLRGRVVEEVMIALGVIEVWNCGIKWGGLEADSGDIWSTVVSEWKLVA